MQRFADQVLGPTPHIAVLSSGKVGNFVVLTPLLRGLKEKYPTCVLDYFGSDITADFEIHCPYIDARFALDSAGDGQAQAVKDFVATRKETAGPYDLVINCDEFSESNLFVAAALRPCYVAGASLDGDLASRIAVGNDAIQSMLGDDDWNSLAFLQRYREHLTSNYIGEIFCRLAYVETDYFRLELPSADVSFEVPDILVHATATRRAKVWPLDYWKKVADWCHDQGLGVGLVGSTPKLQETLYHGADLESDLLQSTSIVDLRGRTSLLELAGAMKRAIACISVDAGPLHIAAAVGCPTVAIFGNDQDGDGASPIHLWAPRMDHVRLVRSTHKCTHCADNRFKNESCLVDGHPCMRHLQPDAVIGALQAILNQDPRRLSTHTADRTLPDGIHP